MGKKSLVHLKKKKKKKNRVPSFLNPPEFIKLSDLLNLAASHLDAMAMPGGFTSRFPVCLVKARQFGPHSSPLPAPKVQWSPQLRSSHLRKSRSHGFFWVTKLGAPWGPDQTQGAQGIWTQTAENPAVGRNSNLFEAVTI